MRFQGQYVAMNALHHARCVISLRHFLPAIARVGAVAAAGAGRVRVLGPADGIENPRCVAFDGQGNVAVSTGISGQEIVVKLFRYSDWTLVRTIRSAAGTFSGAYGIAFDGHGLMIVTDRDKSSHPIQVFRCSDGQHVRTISSSGDGPDQVHDPMGVACDGKGNIVVQDGKNGRVQVFRLSDGAHVRSIGSKGAGPGQFRSWGYVAFDAEGKLFVSDCYNDTVQVFEYSSGRHLRSIGRAGEGDGELNYCLGIALDCSGQLVVADQDNHRVQVFRCSDGQHVRTICPGDIEEAWGVAIDGEGRMLVCDYSGLQVLQ